MYDTFLFFMKPIFKIVSFLMYASEQISPTLRQKPVLCGILQNGFVDVKSFHMA